MEATSSLDLMRKHRLGLWPSFSSDKLFAHLIMFFSSIAPCVLVAITCIFISIHYLCSLYFSVLKVNYIILKKTLYMRINTFEISFIYDGFGCNKRESWEKYVIWIEQSFPYFSSLAYPWLPGGVPFPPSYTHVNTHYFFFFSFFILVCFKLIQQYQTQRCIS